MSVLIKGMVKPDNCEVCPYAFCHLVNDCPIVDIPTPHGRLIDADALPHYTGYALSANEVAKAVEAAPTIIEAEEGQP